ncbi:hypothetical protein ACN47E_008387 [Coniothyrium glycines]
MAEASGPCQTIKQWMSGTPPLAPTEAVQVYTRDKKAVVVVDRLEKEGYPPKYDNEVSKADFRKGYQTCLVRIAAFEAQYRQQAGVWYGPIPTEGLREEADDRSSSEKADAGVHPSDGFETVKNGKGNAKGTQQGTGKSAPQKSNGAPQTKDRHAQPPPPPAPPKPTGPDPKAQSPTLASKCAEVKGKQLIDLIGRKRGTNVRHLALDDIKDDLAKQYGLVWDDRPPLVVLEAAKCAVETGRTKEGIELVTAQDFSAANYDGDGQDYWQDDGRVNPRKYGFNNAEDLNICWDSTKGGCRRTQCRYRHLFLCQEEAEQAYIRGGQSALDFLMKWAEALKQNRSVPLRLLQQAPAAPPRNQ